MSEIKQGALANLSGHILEKTIIPMMQGYGYRVYPCSILKQHPELQNEDKVVFTNVPFESIYNHLGKTEYVIINSYKGRQIRVEAKNQQSAGSVDEKLPNLFLNAVYSYPEKEIILLIEGNGWKQGALNWLHNAIYQYNNDRVNVVNHLIDLAPVLAPGKMPDYDKSIEIMNLSEFLSFFTKELA